MGSSASRIFGLAGERHGDRRALPHAAGELVRVALARRAAGMPTSSSSSPARVGAAAPSRDAVEGHRLGDLPADLLHRVERVHRALEHHRDVASSGSGADRVLAAGQDVLAVEQDLARTRDAFGGSSPISARTSSSCRSRTRRPARTARPGRSAKLTPWTACSSRRAADRTRRAGPRPRAGCSYRVPARRPASGRIRQRRTDRWPTCSRGLSASSIACPIRKQPSDDDRDREPGGHDRPPGAGADRASGEGVLEDGAPRR